VGNNKGVINQRYTSLKGAKIAANRYHTEHVKCIINELSEHTTGANLELICDDHPSLFSIT
jgi:hypothetical protein